MSATSGCKDKGIKTIFLWFNLRLFDLAGIILWNLKGLTPEYIAYIYKDYKIEFVASAQFASWT